MTCMSRATDIAEPLIRHHRFLQYTMTTRHGDNDKAFETPLNEYDFPPGEIFFHGVHALHRAVVMITQPDLKFRQIPMDRKPELGTTEELLTLYKEAIDGFVAELEKMSDDDIEAEIPSPLNGQPIKRKEWFAQSVMHTIHHTGQATRLQGIVDRKLTNTPADYTTASDYTPMYKS